MAQSLYNIANATPVVEGGTAYFTVTRSGDTSRTERITYTVKDGSAVGAWSSADGTADYQSFSDGTLWFSPGETSQKIAINTFDDVGLDLSESTEFFLVQLNRAEYQYGSSFFTNQGITSIVRSGATGYIYDNDSPIQPVSTDTAVSQTSTILPGTNVWGDNNTIINGDQWVINNTWNVQGSVNADVLHNGINNRTDDKIRGGAGNDELNGYWGADTLEGEDGDDNMHGMHGRDVLTGGDGSDILRGGHGHDVLMGGSGSDWIWGGIGANTVNAGANDGVRDRVYVPVDSLRNDNGNPNGVNADILSALGTEDEIFIHGISDADLTFERGALGNSGGVNIYANGTLEAFVQGSLTADQVDTMTTGGFFSNQVSWV